MVWSADVQPIGQGTNGPKNYRVAGQDINLSKCILRITNSGLFIMSFFVKVADHPNVNGIALQQLSFISIGVCTMLLTAAPFFQVSLIGFCRWDQCDQMWR